MMQIADIWPLLKAAGVKYGADPHLLAAFVLSESLCVPQKTRYESKWEAFNAPQTHATALGITVITEKIAQMHSYGLMQVMGATARDLGFRGYLHEICQLELGIELGARYFGTKIASTKLLEDAIAAYNSGTVRRAGAGLYQNQPYVDGVKKNLEIVKGMGLG